MLGVREEPCAWLSSALPVLELEQHKNEYVQSKKIPVLKLPRFFRRCIGDEQERQFQNWKNFLPNGVVFTLS